MTVADWPARVFFELSIFEPPHAGKTFHCFNMLISLQSPQQMQRIVADPCYRWLQAPNIENHVHAGSSIPFDEANGYTWNSMLDRRSRQTAVPLTKPSHASNPASAAEPLPRAWPAPSRSLPSIWRHCLPLRVFQTGAAVFSPAAPLSCVPTG